MADTDAPGTAPFRLVLAFALLVVLAGGALARAHLRPLWHDEIFTWYVARQADLPGIWSALRAGTDLNPPLYHVLVHFTSQFVTSDRLAVRLPALLGFTVMLGAIALFVRHRCGSAPGATAAVAIALSGASPYAYEGRPYGLVLGAGALALLAWQRAARDRASRAWAPLLAFALTVALASHYYAILLLVPIALGELVRVTQSRQYSASILCALVLPPLTLLAWMPLMTAAQDWSDGFWSKPSLESALSWYPDILSPLGGPVIGALALVGVVAALVRSNWLPPARTPRGRAGMPGHELVALTALAALPLMALVVAWSVTGAWHTRYALPAILGVAGLTAAGVYASGTLATRALASVLILSLAVQTFGRLSEWRLAPGRPVALTLVDPDVPNADSLVPILASDGRTYLEMMHYAPPDLRQRLIYIRKPPSVIVRTGSDTQDRSLALLARLTPLRLERLDLFLEAHSRFEVIGRETWVIDELLSRGIPLRLADRREDLQRFVVAPAPGPPAPTTAAARTPPVTRPAAASIR